MHKIQPHASLNVLSEYSLWLIQPDPIGLWHAHEVQLDIQALAMYGSTTVNLAPRAPVASARPNPAVDWPKLQQRAARRIDTACTSRELERPDSREHHTPIVRERARDLLAAIWAVGGPLDVTEDDWRQYGNLASICLSLAVDQARIGILKGGRGNQPPR